MKIVTLDGETLPLQPQKPEWCSSWQFRTSTAVDEIVSALTGATIAITNKVPLRAATLAQLPDLRYICVAATGFDCTDLDACRERGIVVSNVPGYSTRSVSEGVIAFIFALRRQLTDYVNSTRAVWPDSPHFCVHRQPVLDIANATLGIVGKGDIGNAVGKMAAALGMKVLFAERKGNKTVRDGYVSFDEMLTNSDVISLHCPLNDQTRQLIDRQSLSKMKPQGLLINTARGGLINEADLVLALREGKIGGAALDVLSSEPPDRDNPLLQASLPNLLLTPHIAWASQSGVHNLLQGIAANLAGFKQNAPINVVS
ncbi:MAG: D-2-hydroxyacid dehydrogenase [Enterobacterales bacterium endosymbiont of Blomia tropicalis]|uniref:D-2-hydroxyacid dehydrogenase n=1 Tax=Mixta mediterraneensis TaxID=2758443 RepID=UPI0025A71063|nr:D-2-hydroxyacid dehydrogenase [Mixta mediterraneensis]MDL4915429.1 D-2-hydroxyacid dehydrogenase [Mixta mediterraneensis]